MINYLERVNMKHQFLLTLDTEHSSGYVKGMLCSRLPAFVGDFNNVTLDVFPNTTFAPPARAVPEEVRALARQILIYTGVRPAMVTIYEDHFKAHDEGGELTPHEQYTDQQTQHIVSLFRDAAGATMDTALPHTYHLEQVFSDEELDLLGQLQGNLNDLHARGVVLLHDGTFDTVEALQAQIKDTLGRSGP